MLVLALSKGRILEQALPLLAAAGVAPRAQPASRSLVVETADPQVRVMVLRATDVPTFVAHGAADLGIAGRDVLLEREAGGLYEPLDLVIARCGLVVAAPAGARLPRRPRVATKYERIARRHFAANGCQAEVIKLYGSMEIAPAAGLADCIVDLVDSGRTLRENGLQELETICEVSSRVVVNKASMKLAHDRVCALLERLERAALATGEVDDGLDAQAR